MSFASILGSAIGKSAAYAVDGVTRAGQMTGQFGADLYNSAVDGAGQFGTDLYNSAVDGYTTKAAELSAARAAARKQTPLQVNVARKAKAKAKAITA